MVEDILDIPDIPVVEGTQVAAAVQKGIPMVEVGGKGLSTLSDSNSAHTD